MKTPTKSLFTEEKSGVTINHKGKVMVYVAGPYTLGDVAVNVRNAINTTNDLINEGFIPVCPHLSHFLHMHCPQPYEKWMEIDFELLRRCDALLRVPGKSSGADREMAFAERNDIKIFHTINSLKEYFYAERN